MTKPDQLEKDIDRTRGSLSSNVDRLNDKVSPSKVVSRRVDRLKNGAGSMKERIMGYADNSDGSRSEALNSAASSVQDKTGAAAAKVSDAASGAPQAVRDQTEGNPLAVGLIAFGAGWLISALIPVSDAEQDVAAKVEDNSAALMDSAKSSAQQVAGNLQEPAQDAAQQLKSSADDAASKTTEQARSASDDLRQRSPFD